MGSPGSTDGKPLTDTAALNGGDASPDSSVPRHLKVMIAEQRLLIDWKDGAHSEFSMAELRKACPCATCRTEREKQHDNPLYILKSDPTDVVVTTARLVGNYAIQFDWSDGHNTGIFDFRMLRSLKCSRT